MTFSDIPMSYMTFKPEDFFLLKDFEHKALFADCKNVWDALKQIAPYLEKNLQSTLLNSAIGFPYIDQRVSIGKGTVVEDGAMIKGPAIIGENCEIRHGAYIRGNVIIGNGCVIGNSCEVKNSILLDRVEVPHYNYVGDSILGNGSHLGAGAICSNFKLAKTNVSIRFEEQVIDTGLRKFGAVIGDDSQVGCNSVLNPGSVLGKNCILYSGVQWRGVLAADSIVKLPSSYLIVERKKG